jgi:ribosome recycling factor
MQQETGAIQKDAEQKMKKSIESVENNLKSIRTGRPSYVTEH